MRFVVAVLVGKCFYSLSLALAIVLQHTRSASVAPGRMFVRLLFNAFGAFLFCILIHMQSFKKENTSNFQLGDVNYARSGGFGYTPSRNYSLHQATFGLFIIIVAMTVIWLLLPCMIRWRSWVAKIQGKPFSFFALQPQDDGVSMSDFCWKDHPTTLQHFLGGRAVVYSLHLRNSLEIHHRKWAGQFDLEVGSGYTYV